MLVISDTFAIESLGSPVTRAVRLTFPGANAHLRLEVSGIQTTVLMLLLFSASDNYDGSPKTRTGSCRLRQIRPRDFALANHHSLCSSTRRDAAAAHGSEVSPISAQALFICSVISSGEGRARYSFNASLYKRLRKRLV